MNDVVVESWYSIMAPAAKPPDIVKKLQDTVVAIAIANEKSFAAHLADQGVSPRPGSTADAAKFMEKQVSRWVNIVRNARIQMD